MIPVEPTGVNVGLPGTGIYTDANSNTFNSTFVQNTPGLNPVGSTGNPAGAVMVKFSDPKWSAAPYSGMTSICAQKKWASQYGINWDGVSNYNSC